VEILEESEELLLAIGEDGTLREIPRVVGGLRKVHSYLADSSSIQSRAFSEPPPPAGTVLRHPVESREDFFEKIAPRLKVAAHGRYPMWWPEVVRTLTGREYPLCLPGLKRFGLYSRLRQWLGPGALRAVLMEAPRFAEEMLEFLVEFFSGALKRAVTDLEVDLFLWSEDFSDQTGRILPEKLFERFLLPRYLRINQFLGAHGVGAIILEAQGDLNPLLPGIIRAGFTGISPVDCTAGMDPLMVRKTYGKDLKMFGGINHRLLYGDPKALERELLAKIPSLIDQGGYLPGLDRRVPSEVPYQSWLSYLRLKTSLLAGTPDPVIS
jgi:uroporphyrinogen decarboxylase